MHLRTQNQPSQTDKPSPLCPFSPHSTLSTNNLNTKFYRALHDGSYLSISISTPVPKLPGKTKLPQTSVPRSPVHTSSRSTVPAHYRTSGAQLSRLIFILYEFLTLLMWQSNSFHEPRSLPKHSLTLQVPFLSHNFLLSYNHLQALRASRINYNLTNLSRCKPLLMVLFFNAF